MNIANVNYRYYVDYFEGAPTGNNKIDLLLSTSKGLASSEYKYIFRIKRPDDIVH